MLKINSFNQNISFGQINKDYQGNGDIYARQVLRDRLEDRYLGGYRYAHQFASKTPDEVRKELNLLASKNLYGSKAPSKKDLKVDFESLEKLRLFVRPKRKNELYSGGKLIMAKDGVEIAKKAGIKTVVSMGPDFDNRYRKAVLEAGLNFISVDEIGNKALTFHSITPDTINDGLLLRKMIRNPDCWATIDENGNQKKGASKEVLDFQKLIDILDGLDETLIEPIYYGCEYGAERTFAWTTVYGILRNQDRTKPLSEDVVQQLKDFEKLEADY